MITLDDLAHDGRQNADHEMELLEQKISLSRDQVLDIENCFQSRGSKGKNEEEEIWLQIEDQMSDLKDHDSIFKSS